MRLSLLVFAILVSFQAYATKPCPPLLCDFDGNFDAEKCAEKSEWVAIGSISHVVNDHADKPLNKNFATFDLLVDSWRKNPNNYPKRLSFKTGWCTNSQELPKNYKGQFVFYGGTNSFNSNPVYYGFTAAPP